MPNSRLINPNSSRRHKLNAIRNKLHESFIERKEVADGILLSLLAQEHLLILGPPGTAKSLLAVTLCNAIEGAKYFQRLLTKFSTDKEIFVRDTVIEETQSTDGNKSIKFIANTEGMLPSAHIAFLDEIFKCNSATLNSLLTLINERKYYTNDGHIIPCPLQTLIGASNEPPASDEGLEALYDRFLLRYLVNYISDGEKFKQMLRTPSNDFGVKISFKELLELQAQAMTVDIPNKIFDDIANLRRKLQDQGIINSDRRYKKCLKLLKAKAFLDNRDCVKREDLKILQHSLWSGSADSLSKDRNKEISKVKKIVVGIASTYEEECMGIYEEAKEIFKLANDVNKTTDEKAFDRMIEYSKKIIDLNRRIMFLKDEAEQNGESIDSIEDRCHKVKKFSDQIIKLVIAI